MSTEFKRVNFLLGTDTAGQPVYISDQILATGLWLLGPPGQGKTSAMLALIKQGLIKKIPQVYIDRHGDGCDELMAFASRHDSLAETIIHFDPLQKEIILGFDIMHLRHQLLCEKVASLIQACHGMMGEGALETPRANRWMANVFEALLVNKCAFVEALALTDILDNPLRTALIEQVKHLPSGAEWRLFEKLKYPQQRLDQLESSLNRIRNLVQNERLSLMLGTKENILSLDDLVTNNKTLILDMSQRGCLSDLDGDILATLIMHEIIAFVRARPKPRKPLTLYVDEYQKSCSRLTAESHAEDRKHGLRWVVANQIPSQLKDDPQIFHSVKGNILSKLIFGNLPFSEIIELEPDVFTNHDINKIKDEIHTTKVLSYKEEQRTIRSQSETDSETSVDSYMDADGVSSCDTTAESSGLTNTTGFTSSISSDPNAGLFEDGPVRTNEGVSEVISEALSQMSGHSDAESHTHSEGHAEGTSHSRTQGTSKIPFLVPKMGRELSSRTFESLENQRFVNCVQMKQLPKQTAILKILNQKPKQVKIRDVKTIPASEEQLAAFKRKMFAAHGCYNLATEIEKEIEVRHEKLLKQTNSTQDSNSFFED